MRRHSLIFLFFLVVFAACDSNPTDPDPFAVPVIAFVGNQGNFADNNGTITTYSIETGMAQQDAVPNLGGIVQRVIVDSDIGDRLFVLLNFDDSFSTGRGRLDQVNVETGTRIQQIVVSTPRDMTGRSTGVEYVSNLYAGSVTPVDLGDGSAGQPIQVGDNPEGILAFGNRLYVANSGFGFGTTVSVIDIDEGAVVDTLKDICVGPRTMLADAEAEVWLFCSGYSDFNTGEVIEDGEVVVFDGYSGDIISQFSVSGVLGAASLGQDASFSYEMNEMAVIVGNDVLRFDTISNTMISTITVPGAVISAVAYHESQLFLGRPDPDNPYSAAGFVSIHDLNGNELSRFVAGIAPGSIAFSSGSVEG